VIASSMNVQIAAYKVGGDRPEFRGAQIIIDDRLPKLVGPLVRCTGDPISAVSNKAEDRLLVNLDDETIRHLPGSKTSNDHNDLFYVLNVQAIADTCYCRWHIELDLAVDEEISKLLIDATGVARTARAANRSPTASRDRHHERYRRSTRA